MSPCLKPVSESGRIEFVANWTRKTVQYLQTAGTTGGELSLETGAKGVLEVLHAASAKDNGCFFNIDVPTWKPQPGQNEYKGGKLPW